MNKTRIFISTLFIALLATFGIATSSAFAQDDPAALNTPTTSIPLQQVMNAGSSVDLSGIQYNISFAGKTYDGALGTGVYAYTGTLPSDITIKADGAAGTTETPVTVTTDTGKTWDYTRTLADLFGADAATNFPQAGMYEFTISGSHSGGSSDDASKWSYGNESYTLQVVIKNTITDGAITGREYAGWTLLDKTGAKVNSSDENQNGKATFTATYSGTTSLNVTKQVAGEYASTTYAFPQEITLILPDWAADTTSITANGGQSGQWTASSGATRTYTVNLAHGETITFSNLPVGTRYGVHETGQVDIAGITYQPDIAWTVDQSASSSEPSVTELTSKVWRVAGSASGNYLVATNEGVSTADGTPLDTSLYAEMPTLKSDAVAIANGDTDKIAEYTAYMNAGDIFIFPANTSASEMSDSNYDGSNTYYYDWDTEHNSPQIVNPQIAAGDKSLQMRIIGINHDNAANGGTAGLTFQAAHILPHYYRMNPCDYSSLQFDDPQNIGGWRESELRNIMNPDEITADVTPSNNQYKDLTAASKNAIWDIFPTDLQNAIVPVVKMTQNTGGALLSGMTETASPEEQEARLQAATAYEVSATTDKVWIASLRELTPSSVNLGETALSWRSSLQFPWANLEGTPYAYWNAKNTSLNENNPYLSHVNGISGAEIAASNTGKGSTASYDNTGIYRSLIYPSNAHPGQSNIWQRTVDPVQFRAFKLFGNQDSLTTCYFAGACMGILPCFCL